MITTKRKRTIAHRGILWTVAVAVGLLCTGPVFAQGSPSPPDGPFAGAPAPLILTASDSTPIIGDQVTFDVGINLTGVTGRNCNSSNAAVVLAGYTVRLDYDSSILNLASASGGSTAPYSGIAPTIGPPDPDGSGYVLITADQPSSNSPTGLVMFARVKFDTVALGPVNVTATTVSMSSALQCSGGSTGYFGGPSNISAIPDVEAVTVVDEPPPPGKPDLIAPANGSVGLTVPVTFSWTSATNADYYQLYLAKNGAGWVFSGKTSNTSVMRDNLESGAFYYWRVVAYTNEGGKRESSTWSFTMGGGLCDQPDPPVTSLPAEANTGSEYALSWDPIDGATGYRVEESLDPEFGVVSLSSVAGDVTELSLVKNVFQDTVFYYRVAALNEEEPCEVSSEYSAVLQITILADPMRVATIPVVGKQLGAFGSNFGTLVQFHNPAAMTITGNLRFYRRAGVGASEADVSTPYSIHAGETKTVDDLLGLLAETGIGSLDVAADMNMPLPITIARIFNTLEEGGTTGAAMAAIDSADRLIMGDTAVLIAPPDLTTARFNIGLRTFGQGATITVTLKNGAGTTVKTFSRTYGSDYFNQWAADDFLVTSLGEEDAIYFSIDAGSAIIYGSWTDNTTNDPAIQVATLVEQ